LKGRSLVFGGLLSALDETPEDWTRHFKAEWNAIEVEYAAALSRGTALPGPSAQGVQEAAEKCSPWWTSA
jgi:hypothetical protein